MTLSVRFTHSFPGAAFDISFAAPTPGATVLFGPSGSGKSTVLAAIAGLLRPATCRIAIGGEVLADETVFIPPERRRIGVVFQDSRLFPHMSVVSNLRFGQRRAPPGRIGFDDVVGLLGIASLLGRRPHSLSGGEKQRVAIGRALLMQPQLLAMDEPLAGLDAARKAEILPYLARLKTMQVPILYVTHDLLEAARFADTLVLIAEGRVSAAGPLPEVVSNAALPLAARDDAASVLPARVAAHDPARQLTRIEAAGRDLLAPLLSAPVGAELRVRIPAREVILAAVPPGLTSVHNVLEGRVGAIVFDAPAHAALVEVVLDDGRLLARVTQDAVTRLGLTTGGRVLALVKSVAVEPLG